MKTPKNPGERSEIKISGPLGIANEGDFIKVGIGDSLALGRVTQVHISRYVSSLEPFDPLLEAEGEQYSHAINTWQEDALGNPLPGGQRILLPTKTNAEAEAIFQRWVVLVAESNKGMLSNQKTYASMQAAELDTHKAQWEVLKDVWPTTLQALGNGTDPTKDYNAEAVAITGSPSLPIEAGDADAMDKILAAQNRKRELDPVNVELSINWIKEGYRDMKPEEYTAKINAKLHTNLSVSAMKSRAITKLRLASRRSEGRPANDGELPPG